MPASTVLQLRRGTASQWSSANPILAQGEMGYETDTSQFKLGDGSSTWSALSYGGLSGPQSTSVLESYGDGSDGNTTISSGVTTLVRDMYYNNLTINGTGQINAAGFKIFIKGILDITAAPVAAIFNSGGAGASTGSQAGGAAGTAAVGVTVGQTAGAAGAGGTSTTGVGVQGAVSSSGQNGGATNPSGASGAGGPNAGSTAGAAARAGIVPVNPFPIRRYETDLLRGATLITPGAGGPGGAGGSGDGVTVGNSLGGGGGGGGGGVLGIWAKTINRGASTAVGAIQATGGIGGNARSGLGTYTFTVPTGNIASVGATFTNNGQTFEVTTALITSGTSLVARIITAGVPTNTGTLTLASGVGSATITFTAIASITSSAAAALAGIGGGGGGAGGSGGWIMLQYDSLTGSTATNCIDASGGPGGIGGNGANNYTFTVTAGQTASIGATFTNNGQTFYVTTALLVAGTSLVTVGTGAPSASGTLTKQNGISSANITFSAFTGGTTAVGGGSGQGGNGGRITLLQVPTSTGSESFTGTGTGNSASGIFGGAMGPAGINRVSL